MIRPCPRPIRAVDVVILLLGAAVGAALAFATDREYMAGHGGSPALIDGHPSPLPIWFRGRRHDAIRLLHGSSAMLVGLGLGLAVVTFRPREGGIRRGRLGPGHVAVALTGLVSLMSAAAWTLDRVTGGKVAALNSSLSGPLNLYEAWKPLRPRITLSILGAWLALALAGLWRQPIDGADRLGRWLAWGWVGLMALQGLIYVIVWF